MTWILKRIAISVLLVWVVASIVYLSIHLIPGDPAEVLLSMGGGSPSAASIEALRRQLGLDQPIYVQYFNSMLSLAKGDLGRSMQDGTSVASEIARRLPRTLELIAAAGLIAVVFGMSLGIFAALRRGRVVDRVATALAGLSVSIPVFVIGTLLIMVFAQRLRLVPAGGFVEFTEDPGRHLILLAMPAVTTGLGLAGIVLRMTRASVLDTLQHEHVRAARARGLGPRSVMWRHVLRNALAPVITVLALNLGSMLGGSVLVEYVFNWPGISGLLVGAVNARDYTTVVGCVVVISALFVLLNLCIDIVYAMLDPRVRYQ